MPEETNARLDDVQDALIAGDVTRLRRTLLTLAPSEEEQLREELGAELLERVKRQARRAARGAKRGRVIVVHGIMGAMLDVIDAKGDSERVWVSFLRLAAGRIADLELGPDEQPKKRSIRVKTAGLDRGTYLPILLELDREWEVLPFAYDWREDIERSADHLAEEVRRFGAGGPVHLVAHSMGGLVSRCMIQRHPALWRAMADPNGLAAGGRLVMLGTPNQGSFAIPLMLSGEEFLVRALALADLSHDKRELLRILSSFPGAYQMMPSPFVDLGDAHADLYRPESWGPLSVRPALIEKAERFHRTLRDAVDAERFTFVAGYDQKTPVGIRIRAPGEFEFRRTREGDGRVPHALGLLPGVRTFWVEEAHGALPKNERVLRGIHELLAKGATSQLEGAQPVRRRLPEEAEWLPAAEVDEQAAPVFERVRAGAKREPTAAQQRALERTVLRDYAGGPRPPAVPAPTDVATRRRPKLKIEVVWGDIAEADGDVYAVGHYQGVLPQRAEWALDRVVSAPGAPLVITEHTKRGTLRGGLGDVNYFKWSDPKHCQRVVAVAGMGRPGSFGVGSLRRLIRELMIALSSLPNVKTVCSVLIGSGEGTLSIADAVLGLVDGMAEAITQATFDAQIEILRIVEREHDRAVAVRDELAKRLGVLRDIVDVSPPELIPGVGKRYSKDEVVEAWFRESRRALEPGAPRAVREAAALMRGRLEPAMQESLVAALGSGGRPSANGPSAVPTRISAARDGEVVRVAAITQTATVAERTTSFDLTRVDEIAALVNDPEAELQDGWPSLLLQLLLPRDFRPLLEGADQIVFELDRFTARIHWEVVARRLASGLARPGAAGLGSALGIELPIARQLRTTYSAPPTAPVESGSQLRALVVGDPGAGPHGLPGARREALAVAGLLARAGVHVRTLIGAPSDRTGLPSRCEAASWLATMEALTEPWDVLHYCGHGDFDPADPSRVGWVFENGLLTAGDIRHLDTAPGLVVANACLSARTSSTALPEPRSARWDREAGLLPSLADEFFKLGVRNYVGASWEVDDLGAIEFAESFYGDGAAGVLAGESIGAALLKTRRRLWEHRGRHGKLWAAYQHYGDPSAALRRSVSPGSGRPSQRRGGRARKK